ncbi:S8 family serine peptidase [Streptomyces longispororuber]|uniref:S8 family peptidase n=1 Tax=Streptomyces longispororuber TaxID=68230 RepID=UPI0037014F62
MPVSPWYALTAVVAASVLAAPTAAAEQRTPAPVRETAEPVPGRYIVTLAPGVPSDRAAERWRLPVRETFHELLNGFSADLSPRQVRMVRRMPGVLAVEQVGVVTAPRDAVRAHYREPTESWGLDRIDQRALPLDGSFTPGGDGDGVTAYVMDSGIDLTHTTFGGRATAGFDAFNGDGTDCYGHGTSVASLVGGATYGVARKAKLVSVKVLDCENKGTSEGVLAGLEWIAKNAVKPAVVNSSLSSPKFATVDAAVDALAGRGVLTVAAGGNQDDDACTRSPAGATTALSVGNSTNEDKESETSNHGRCLSLYAPGNDVLAAKSGGGSVMVSGTSFAAPYTAGAAVLALDAAPETAPAALKQRLVEAATPGVLTVGPGSPNRLLYVEPGSAPATPATDGG